MNYKPLPPAWTQTDSRPANLPATTSAGRQPRILLADDDERIRSFISMALAGANFSVCAVAHGEEAWTALQQEPFDLLVTDNEMPRLTGMQLIERVRAAGMGLPVIVVSGSISGEGWRNHTRLQITSVIPKPFDISEFLGIVQIALRVSNYSPAPRSPSSVEPAHKHVLIADDDEAVRRSLAAVLESEGYTVCEAGNGIEAVTHALQHTPDLVLLDLNMPYADGWTAFSQLDRVAPLLPVIVITARPNQYLEAVRKGVDAFMEKPLNIPALVQAVKRFTDKAEGRHASRVANRAFVTHLLGAAP